MMNTHFRVVDDRKPYTFQQLVDQLKSLSIKEGDILHVKVSAKSLGPVEGGVQTLLDALLAVVGSSGTLVVDAFLKPFFLPMSDTEAKMISDVDSPTYTGVFNNLFMQHSSMVRSRHPVHRFAAIGALAHELMDHHTPLSPAYDVQERLCQLGAKNINIGDGIIGVATTHVAVEESSLVKHNRDMGINYFDENHQVQFYRVDWMGGCSRGCIKFIDEYERQHFVIRGVVGYAPAMVTDMRGTLAVDRQMIAADPTSFFCDDPTCKDCQLRWDHSTGNWFSVKFYSLLFIIKKLMHLK